MFCLINAQWFVLSNKIYGVHFVRVVHSALVTPTDTLLWNRVVHSESRLLVFPSQPGNTETQKRNVYLLRSFKNRERERGREGGTLFGQVPLLQPARKPTRLMAFRVPSRGKCISVTSVFVQCPPPPTAPSSEQHTVEQPPRCTSHTYSPRNLSLFTSIPHQSPPLALEQETCKVAGRCI